MPVTGCACYFFGTAMCLELIGRIRNDLTQFSECYLISTTFRYVFKRFARLFFKVLWQQTTKAFSKRFDYQESQSQLDNIFLCHVDFKICKILCRAMQLTAAPERSKSH